jgi:hypothetical protein
MTTEGFRLYPIPSFLEGLARLSDPAGLLNRYNKSATPQKADAKAIASDWIAVGNDFRKVLNDQKKSKRNNS